MVDFFPRAATSAPPAPRPDEITVHGEEAVRTNVRVARLSIGTVVLLTALKIATAILTGSLSILASLVDSVMDLFASTMNYVAVRMAGRPADADHAYGHGKAEALAGLAQAVVISVSGVYLLVEGTRRLLSGGAVERAEIGIVVMAISTVISAWIAWRLRATARRTGSLALAADSVHYASDVWTNLGVLLALHLIKVFGWQWIDGAFAVGVSFVVLHSAWQVLKGAADELMDKGLPDAEVAGLLDLLQEKVPEVRGLHDVRTRKAGPRVFMDVHVQLDRALSFVEAHRLAERVRIALEAARPGALVNVHADPDPLLPSDLDEGVDHHALAEGARAADA